MTGAGGSSSSSRTKVVSRVGFHWQTDCAVSEAYHEMVTHCRCNKREEREQGREHCASVVESYTGADPEHSVYMWTL